MSQTANKEPIWQFIADLTTPRTQPEKWRQFAVARLAVSSWIELTRERTRARLPPEVYD